MTENKLLFREEQKFRQWWLWLILWTATAVSVVPFLVGIYTQEVLDKPWGDQPSETSMLVFFLLLDSAIMAGVIWLIGTMKLLVEIRSGGIWFRFPPLMVKWKCIKKEEIESFCVRKYNPTTEYGGWGIKGSSRNRAYNVSGNTGLQLFLKNGKKVLFGTLKKQSAEYAMSKMMSGKQEGSV